MPYNVKSPNYAPLIKNNPSEEEMQLKDTVVAAAPYHNERLIVAWEEHLVEQTKSVPSCVAIESAVFEGRLGLKRKGAVAQNPNPKITKRSQRR